MRKLPAGLQDHLDSGATTLCHCWRLVRIDGVVSGYTDHDRILEFDGVAFEPESGFEAAHYQTQVGLSVGGTEIAGVLQSSGLSEDDLRNGLYDNARVEIWRVNWADPQQRMLIDAATIGEIRRSKFGFSAELRGLAHWLDQERGQVFQSRCSADLGDARCRANLDTTQMKTTAAVTNASGHIKLELALTGFADEWFARGRLTFLDGSNTGASQTIRAFKQTGEGSELMLWTPPAAQVAIGDTVELVAGCDKSFVTCREKFSNHANFRGFPHIPGNDALLKHPGAVEGPMDGGSMFT